ncbi:MAG: M64 family metallopeptidase [Kineosporiaceae bacterium]
MSTAEAGPVRTARRAVRVACGLLLALLLAACQQDSPPAAKMTSPPTAGATTPGASGSASPAVTGSSTPASVSSTASSGTASSGTATAGHSPTRGGRRVVPAGLTELVPGHNRVDADRINLVFAGWGWPDTKRLRATALLDLGWDGHVHLVDRAGQIAADGTEPIIGIFGIEPWRSHRDTFNVWLTDRSPAKPNSWLDVDPSQQVGDLPDLAIVTLAYDSGIRSVSGSTSNFFLPDFPSKPMLRRTDDQPFAGVLVDVSSKNPSGSAVVAAHELGHALFGLNDEYIGVDKADTTKHPDQWPACAASEKSARAWWGKLIGRYDPMVDIWAEELALVGQPLAPGRLDFTRDETRVTLVPGGCFGTKGSFRPTQDSLMMHNLPALGLVNTAWANRILALWHGTAG